jgi:uncharacterized damage-inducible protein DinB
MLVAGTVAERAAPARAETLSNDALLGIFESAPARLRETLAGLSRDELSAHPIPGKWSILEIFVHIADSELIGAARFRFAIAEPGSALSYYEEATWARELKYDDYEEERIEATLNLFQSLRETSTSLLRNTATHLWANAALHPRWGYLTVRQLLEIYAEHAERHVGQIFERRALLGRALDGGILLAP